MLELRWIMMYVHCVQLQWNVSSEGQRQACLSQVYKELQNKHIELWSVEAISDLLRMAASSTQGILVAPSTKIPSLLFPTPTKPESFSQLYTICLLSVRAGLGLYCPLYSTYDLKLHIFSLLPS